MQNGLNSINIFYAGSHKSLPIHYFLWGDFLNRISVYLYCTNYNEINIFHCDTQKHASFTGSHKKFLYYGLCFETADSVFLVVS